MSHEAKTQSIRTGRKLYKVTDTQTVDREFVLPDYCKEIKRLLKCTFVPGVHSVSISGEKVSAKGTGTIRVLYIGEGDTVDVFEKSCELTFGVQMKNIPADAAITTRQRVDFLNCRVTGQRKLSVNAGISTLFCCFCTEEAAYVSCSEDAQVKFKTQKLDCEVVSGFYEKTFDMSETVVLANEKAAAEKIISCEGYCVLESKKQSSGKLLIKGEVRVNVCYLPEKKENCFEQLTHSLPISQIVDVGEGGKEGEYNVRLNVKQLLCNLKSDSSGSNRLIELVLRVSAFVCAKEKKRCEVITDCYCPGYEIEAVYGEPDFYNPIRDINEHCEKKSKIDFSSPVKEICSVRCLDVSESLSFDYNKAKLSCSALLGIVYLDENSEVSYCEKNADFEQVYSIMKKCESPSGEFSVEITGVSVKPDGGEKAEVTLECHISGRLYCSHEKRILKKLEVLKEKTKDAPSPALTVYFMQKEESLWEIAKAHDTTVELIMEENGLKEEKNTGDAMILIPCI